MNARKRLLSWVLTLAMLASFLPATVLTASAADVNVSVTVTVNGATADLKNATMYYSSSPNQPITIQNGAITSGTNQYTSVPMTVSGKQVSATTQMSGGSDGSVTYYLVIIAQDQNDVYCVYAFNVSSTDGATFTAGGGAQQTKSTIASNSDLSGGGNFVVASAQIKTATTGAGSGKITGGGYYGYNKTATLTATANTGSKFVKWSDGSTDNPRTITVTGDATYTAEFIKLDNPTVTVTGNATVGETLTAAITGQATTPVTYQWQYYDGSAWRNIDGAASTSYQVDVAYFGYPLRLQVKTSGTGAVTTESTQTAAVNAVLAANTGSIDIAGQTYTNSTANPLTLTKSGSGVAVSSGTYGAAVTVSTPSGSTTTYQTDAAAAITGASSGNVVALSASVTITDPIQVPDGVTVKGSGSTTMTGPGLVKFTNGRVEEIPVEARIGDTRYATLDAALTAAAGNAVSDTIVMEETVTPVNGKTLTSDDILKNHSGQTYTATSDAALDVADDGAVTLKTGSLNVSAGGAVTVNDGTKDHTVTSAEAFNVTGGASGSVGPVAAGKSVTIDGVKYTASTVAPTNFSLSGNLSGDGDMAEIPASTAATVKVNDKASVTTDGNNSGKVTVTKGSGDTGVVAIAASGDKVTIGGKPYTTAAANTELTIGSDGAVSVTKGAVKLDDGQDVLVNGVEVGNPTSSGSDAVTVTKNADGSGSVKVPAGGKVTIGGVEYTNPGSGEAEFVIGTDRSVKLSTGSAQLDKDEAVSVQTGGASGTAIQVTNDSTDPAKKVSVTAGSPNSTAVVDQGGTVTIGGKTYTNPGSKDATFTFDKTGGVTLTDGSAELDGGESITTKPTGGASVTVENPNDPATGKKVTVEAGAPTANESKITVDPEGGVTIGGVTYTNPDPSKKMEITVDPSGNPVITGGSVELDKDEGVYIGTTGTKLAVTNTGDPALVVSADSPSTGKTTVKLPQGGSAQVGNSKIESPDNDVDVVVDQDGSCSVDLEPGESVTIDGVVYVADPKGNGATIEVDRDGKVNPTGDIKLTIDPTRFTDPNFKYTLLPGVPVACGGYVYTIPQSGNTGAVTLNGVDSADPASTGNPMVEIANSGDHLDVSVADANGEPVSGKTTTYTAAGADTQFTMTNPQAAADDAKINLLGKDGSSGLRFSAPDANTAPQSVTIDGVTYAGEKGTSYSVTYGTKDILDADGNDTGEDAPSHRLTVTPGGKVTAAFSQADQSLAYPAGKVNGETVPVTAKDGSGNVTFTAGSVPSTLVFENKGSLTVTAGSSTGLVPVKDKAGNVTGYESRYTPPVILPPDTVTNNNAGVNVPKPLHGSVTVTPARPATGAKVTLTVKPDKGYELTSLTVRDANGNDLPLTDEGSGRYSFYQPKEAPVTVDAAFGPEGGALPFTDVDGDDWFYDAVKYVYDNGLMNGVSGTEFGWNMPLTRGMIVTILWRLEREPQAGLSAFLDVEPGEYYAEAVAWAADNGVVNGYSAAAFGPKDHVTREQLAAIVYRYAVMKGYDTTAGGMALREFADYGAISAYALTAMNWAFAEGLVSGVSSTRLDPAGDATRAQVAVVLMRLCENVAKT